MQFGTKPSCLNFWCLDLGMCCLGNRNASKVVWHYSVNCLMYRNSSNRVGGCHWEVEKNDRKLRSEPLIFCDCGMIRTWKRMPTFFASQHAFVFACPVAIVVRDGCVNCDENEKSHLAPLDSANLGGSRVVPGVFSTVTTWFPDFSFLVKQKLQQTFSSSLDLSQVTMG